MKCKMVENRISKKLDHIILSELAHLFLSKLDCFHTPKKKNDKLWTIDGIFHDGCAFSLAVNVSGKKI